MHSLFAILKKQFPVFLFLCAASMLVVTGVLAQSTVSDQDDLDISAVVPTNAPPGGGSGGSHQYATVSLNGFSFPGAKLTLLKDGVVTTILVANNDGTFHITINNLNIGNYQFSIYAEDPQGVTSSPYVINIPIFSIHVYPVNGIIIPPTLRLDPQVVQAGQGFNARGYVAPGAIVTLEIPGNQTLGTAVADSAGLYTIAARASLPPGTYQLRSKAQLNGAYSYYSRPVDLTIYAPGQLPPRPPTPLGLCVDYNKDGRVNLTDFSILLFWFGQSPVPPNIDCNADKLINMKDFSILMYYWTG